ncbi:hypothetical protein HYV22_04340 [Candidatus Gottesmanbacteria bacterium]|nr:hypothetical protein [Candidatus Gottesmanbacteria bacterium]
MDAPEQGSLPAREHYLHVLKTLAQKPQVTAHEVRGLFELKKATLEVNPQEFTDLIYVSLVMSRWDRGYRLTALEYLFHKTLEASMVEESKELARFWIRCTDGVLNEPLFPENPQYYPQVLAKINQLWKNDPGLYGVLSQAIIYNKELAMGSLNAQTLDLVYRRYTDIRDTFFHL